MSSLAVPSRDASGKHLRGELLNEPEGLTIREREVLEVFAEGLGTEAAARCLSISRVTVRNHSQRILTKLGVHSRLAAVARAYRDGLIGRETGLSPRGVDALASLPPPGEPNRIRFSKTESRVPGSDRGKVRP